LGPWDSIDTIGWLGCIGLDWIGYDWKGWTWFEWVDVIFEECILNDIVLSSLFVPVLLKLYLEKKNERNNGTVSDGEVRKGVGSMLVLFSFLFFLMIVFATLSW